MNRVARIFPSETGVPREKVRYSNRGIETLTLNVHENDNEKSKHKEQEKCLASSRGGRKRRNTTGQPRVLKKSKERATVLWGKDGGQGGKKAEVSKSTTLEALGRG